MAGWLILRSLSGYIHLPPNVPLRLSLLLPILAGASLFSVSLSLLWRWLEHKGLRLVTLLLTLFLGLLAAGASLSFWSPFRPLDGVRLMVGMAWHSPIPCAVTVLWVTLWSHLVLPLLKASVAPQMFVRETPEVAEEWAGSTR